MPRPDLTPASPLVTITRAIRDQFECQACPMTLDDPAPQGVIVTLLFATGPHTGMEVRYCEAHYAQIVALLVAAQEGPRNG